MNIFICTIFFPFIPFFITLNCHKWTCNHMWKWEWNDECKNQHNNIYFESKNIYKLLSISVSIFLKCLIHIIFSPRNNTRNTMNYNENEWKSLRNEIVYYMIQTPYAIKHYKKIHELMNALTSLIPIEIERMREREFP